MGLSILIDRCSVDSGALYEAIQTELAKYEIPDLQYDRGREECGRGFFKGPAEEVRTLIAHNGVHRVVIMAYQYGANFFLSTRRDFQSITKAQKMSEQIERGTFPHLEEVQMGCFGELVERGTRAAVVAYIEETGGNVPSNLNPADVFTVGV